MVTVDPEVDPKVGKNVPHTRDIVVYFCVPTCGKAIGLRPGDFLLYSIMLCQNAQKHMKTNKHSLLLFT